MSLATAADVTVQSGFVSNWIGYASTLAILLLAVHAIATHGWFFAANWLAVPALLGAAVWSVLALGSRVGFVPVQDGPIVTLPVDVLLAWTTSVYLSAVFAKGFVERTRWKGESLPFALSAVVIWLLLAYPFVAANEARSIFYFVGASQIVHLDGSIGTATPLGVLWTFGSGVLVLCLAYRAVSRRTEHNGVKLAVLLALLPVMVAVSSGIGWVSIESAAGLVK